MMVNLPWSGFKLPNEKKDDIMSSMNKRVETRWGYWEELCHDESLGFRVKILVLYPGKEISLQYHDKRSEHWAVIKGDGMFTLDNMQMMIGRDDGLHVPLKMVHKVANIGSVSLVIVETQIGICDEKDITRLEEIEGLTNEPFGEDQEG